MFIKVWFYCSLEVGNINISQKSNVGIYDNTYKKYFSISGDNQYTEIYNLLLELYSNDANKPIFEKHKCKLINKEGD